MQLQQGDVTFETVEKRPEGLKKLIPVDGKYVLAEGEATGHAHTILPDGDGVDVYVADDGTIYADVKTDSDVSHQEHGTVKLMPALWRIGRILTKNWITRMTENVVD